MSLIVYAIPFFLACIALEMLISVLKKRKVYRFHDTVTSLNIGFISETIRVLVKLLTVVVYAVVLDKVAAFQWDIKSPWVWVLAFFMYDFFYYWAHRSGHEINLLWAAHVVHHSSEDYNLGTALRQSSTNQVFYWIFYLPMAIAGIPVSVFVTIALISALYQFWSHTQLVPKLGWADRVFVTPSNHRCHHGRNDYCLDKNYGGTLIIWDRLFGTYTEERDDEPVVYGTLKPLQSWNPVWGNLKNYVALTRDTLATAGWRNKLMRVFAPPAWTPEGQPVETVDMRHYTPFETPSTRLQRVYGVLGSATVLALVVHLLLVAADLSMGARILYTVLIACNTACLAWVFEGKSWALALESLRNTLTLGSLTAGVWFSPVAPKIQIVAALVLLLSWALLWRINRERVAQANLQAVQAVQA